MAHYHTFLTVLWTSPCDMQGHVPCDKLPQPVINIELLLRDFAGGNSQKGSYFRIELNTPVGMGISN